MGFDIKKRPDKTEWARFSEDEKYLLKYLPQDEWAENSEGKEEKEIESFLFSHVINWDGIFANGEPLDCNDENKRLVFYQNDVWSTERLQFVMFNIMNPNNFFNYDENLKNLRGASK